MKVLGIGIGGIGLGLGKIERRRMVICVVVGLLGLTSTALGFAAEAKRIKVSQVNQVSAGICSYPRSPAYALGISSALSLLLAQLLINFSTGCFCCTRFPFSSSTHWTLALLCFIVSWFTFVVAFLLLLGGAALNDQHGAENVYISYYYCYVVKPGVFAMAAILSFASVTLSILYFLTVSSQNNPLQGGPPLPNHAGIAMGQPQVPPTSHDPVFVHQDTYVRRQFT